MLTNNKTDSIFASILSDGLIHVTSAEGIEKAVKREYETSDGTKGSKWELLYTELSGIISDMKFVEGNFGNQLFVTITDGEDKPVILTLGVASSFGEDFMKKIFNVDLSKQVKLTPYSFEDERGKSRKGITIVQDGRKLENFFYDKVEKRNINGYPEVKKGKKVFSKDEWKMYFMEARMFLVDKMIIHFKMNKPVESISETEDVAF